MRAGVGSLAFALALCVAGHVHAQGLPMVEVPDGQVRVDGALRDWQGVSYVTIGNSTSSQLRYVLGHNDAGFYFALKVSDERFVRSARPSPNEDAVVFTFVVPTRAGLRASELWLFAGDMGSTAASIALGAPGQTPRAITAGEIVEGPADRGASGYVLEAFVPFSALPGAAHWQEAHAALRLHDVDSESHPVPNDDVSSARFDPAHPDALPPLTAQRQQGNALAAFLAQNHLDARPPTIDVRADVVGGSESDRVFLAGNTLVMVPTNGAAGAASFAFALLPFDAASPATLVESRDITNDGKAELAIDVTVRSAAGVRVTRYFATFAQGTVDVALMIDIRRERGGCAVTNRVTLPNARGVSRISVEAVRARCADPASWTWPVVETAPFMLPWGEIVGRNYGWQGREFVATSETRNPHPYVAPLATAAAVAAPAPRGAATDLIAQYRQDQHVAPSVRLRFEQSANVGEDATPERVCVLDRAILVTGPRFRAGTSYLFFNIPVASEQDILSLIVDDVTGDGVAELLVRVRQPVGDVMREVLLVHRVVASGAPRLAAIEVARARGTDRIDTETRVVGSARTRHLEVLPGRAHGWTRESYPFTSEPSPGMEALVLPWGTPARYSLRGDHLSAAH